MKISKFYLLVFFIGFGLVLTTSCGDDDDMTECDPNDSSYSNNVKDLLDASCAYSGCHDADGISENGRSMHTYEAAVAAFTIDESRVIGAINHSAGFSNMPKGTDKLSDCNIEKLTNWIDAGYPQ